MIEILVATASLLWIFYWWSTSRQKGLPPGPGMPLPIIGHAYLLKADDPMEQILKWRKQYGDTHIVQFGPKRALMLHSYNGINEALVKNHNVFRYKSDGYTHVGLFKNKGLFSLGGDEWKEQRVFVNSALKSLGLGNNVMATRVKMERYHVLQTLRETNGEPTELKNLMAMCISNIICSVIFGKRFEYSDPMFQKFMLLIRRQFELVPITSPIHFFYSFIIRLPGDFFHIKELKEVEKQAEAIIISLMNKDGRTLNLADESFEDFVQCYLTEIERKKAQGVKNTTIDMENLLYTVWVLNNGGTDTTTSTISFALVYMASYPEIQKKLYKELMDNVGVDRSPDLSDKSNLRYLNAFIEETQRFASIIPISPERCANEDVTIQGYLIPKGTIVMPILDSLMFDEAVWGDPQNFRPERFLKSDQEGSGKIKKEFIPFSTGRRNCVGELMAMTELFLLLSGIIQQFEILPESPDKKPDQGSIFGLTRMPRSTMLRAVSRSSQQ